MHLKSQKLSHQRIDPVNSHSTTNSLTKTRKIFKCWPILSLRAIKSLNVHRIIQPMTVPSFAVNPLLITLLKPPSMQPRIHNAT